jgi:uncharacterized protein YegJ (DUF2314 family)
MKKYKLVLIFNDGNEIYGIESQLMFNNIMDAHSYLMSTDKFISIKITPEEKWFSFKGKVWDGDGRAYWVEDMS